MIRKKSCLVFAIFFVIYQIAIGYGSSDLDAFLMLKSSLLGPAGSGLDDWVAPPPPMSSSSSSSNSAHCKFSGVTCDDDARVVALNVTNVPLFGTIPPEIGLLSNLMNLTLTADNLTGPLPVEISKLTSLKYVNLGWNMLNGTFPDNAVSNLTELEVFDVYNNNFFGNLPVEFVRLKKLRILKLAGNYFSGEIPEAYSKFERLTHLALQGNSLNGRIPADLAMIPNLEELYLGYYNMYSGGIPPEFGSISTLKLLDLAMCNLSGEIPVSIGNLKHLHSLFLQVNNLTGQIPPELSGLASLMSLDLSFNKLTGVVPGNFAKLKNLTLINMFQNEFQGPLPSFIGDLPNLEVLQIWNNNFTLELPENLGRNGRLTQLDVTRNHFTGRIPSGLCKGGRLKTLILMENYFYGPIPGELGGCRSLTRIRIKKNFLNGTIPAGFFTLPSLDMLELNENYLTGELPKVISARLLGSLALSNNWISGKIPEAMGNLKNLEILSLDMNKLSGEIPGQVFRIKKLATLNLSGNSLIGEIPASIAHGSHLTLIDLSRNNLHGVIPRNISRLQNLNVLNLSRNQLDGAIPGEIGLMKSLTVLDLSYNDFSGTRPTTGLLKDFDDDRSFAGNPKLCFPHSTYCPSALRSSQGDQRRHVSKAVIVAILAIAVLLSVPGIWLIFKKRQEKSRAWKLTSFQKLNFRVEDVVACLKEENVIGKGGSGIVYRGSMPNGTDIAIKRLNNRGDHGFTAEIQTMGKIRHRNIARLLGYASNKDTNLLLYEYMSRGSLGEMLRSTKGAHLQWESRYRIAVDAANGLCYLHHDCSPSIIHRDVKSNNILLDSECEAHVADFGLAKFWHEAGTSQCMSVVAGSYGYIAPEYAYTLKVNQKSDVYSFGVVLLELITGRKPVGEFGEGVDIVKWVRKTMLELSQAEDGAALVMAVVDSRLTEYPVSGVANLLKIAMQCVEDESSARPNMREVVQMLTDPAHLTPELIGN